MSWSFSSPRCRSRFYGSPGHYGVVGRDVLLGRTNRGDDVAELESRFSRELGVRHAIAVPQGRVGIYLALRAVLRERRRVVLSPYTIHDVINMVVSAGGIPVFADIERRTCNIDPEQIESLVDDDTGAVLITHLHGLACDVEPIVRICKSRNIALIEDAAQAFGATVGDRPVGTIGNVGVYSFGMAKNINSFYGGLVVTGEDDVASQVRSELANYPPMEMSRFLARVGFCAVGEILTAPPLFGLMTYRIFRYGELNEVEAIRRRVRGEDQPRLLQTIPEDYLRCMTALQARLALRLLDAYKEHQRYRRTIASIYHAELGGIEEIECPPIDNSGSHVYLTYPIQVSDRRALLQYLVRGGRDLAVQHMGNTASYPCFKRFSRTCAVAARTASQVLLLPTYPGYGEDEARRNCVLIRKFFKA